MASGNPHHEADQADDSNMNGRTETTIKPRCLNIVWGEDDRYWTLPKKDEDKPAELLQVCWLEVTGSVDNIKPRKSYEVRFGLSLTPDAFGWGNYPIYIMVKRGKNGKFAWKKEYLTNKGTDKFEITAKLNDSTEDTRLYFGLYEVWSGKWKGGLKINHVTVKEL